MITFPRICLIRICLNFPGKGIMTILINGELCKIMTSSMWWLTLCVFHLNANTCDLHSCSTQCDYPMHSLLHIVGNKTAFSRLVNFTVFNSKSCIIRFNKIRSMLIWVKKFGPCLLRLLAQYPFQMNSQICQGWKYICP